jgi:glycosyltransferase involved in cell wall biosynthesis
MKVLLIATVDPSGKSGHNIATKEVVMALLRNKKVELSVIYPEPENGSYLYAAKRELQQKVYLSAKNTSSLWWNFKIQFQIISAFKKVFNENKPDLIITRMGNCLTLPVLGIYYKIPYYVLIRSLGYRDIKKLSPIPGMQHLWKLAAYLNCRAARHVLVAYEEISQVIGKYRKPDQALPLLFTNAVNIELFPLIDKQEARGITNLGFKESDFVVGFVGSIKKRHCLSTLIDALEILIKNSSDIKVLIVGDGPRLESLKEYVGTKNLGRHVFFTGFVPHEQVHIYMAASDLLYGAIDPSEVENPIKCYEYLATARPVITTRKKEFDFVEQENLGIVIDKLCPEEVSEAVKELLALGDDQRSDMGCAGRKYVLANHTWDKMVDFIIDDYLQI